jgi:hypothetical protein
MFKFLMQRPVTVQTLYQAHLDPPLLEQFRQHSLWVEEPQWAFPLTGPLAADIKSGDTSHGRVHSPQSRNEEDVC